MLWVLASAQPSPFFPDSLGNLEHCAFCNLFSHSPVFYTLFSSFISHVLVVHIISALFNEKMILELPRAVQSCCIRMLPSLKILPKWQNLKYVLVSSSKVILLQVNVLILPVSKFDFTNISSLWKWFLGIHASSNWRTWGNLWSKASFKCVKRVQ